MKLRNKFLLALTLISLVSLSSAAILIFESAQAEITTQITNQLNSVATIQEQRVNEALDRYIEGTKLITSRTQLRKDIQTYNDSQASGALIANIENTANDARQSVQYIQEVSIFDKNNELIATTDPDQKITTEADERGNILKLSRVFKDDSNEIHVTITGPLISNGEIIGFIEVIATAAPLISITSDYTGLGETGEVVIAQKNQGGDSVFLTPLRFDQSAALSRAIPLTKQNAPINEAVAGNELTFTDNVYTDYRGEQIFAVSKYIEALEWGLLVKIDQDEALAPIAQLKIIAAATIILTLLALIVVVVVITRGITGPITSLTKTAQSFTGGNINKRTDVHTQDEVGELAETFNSMADEIQDFTQDLEKKVKQRTKELREKNAQTQALLNSIGDAVVFTDASRRIISLNYAAEQLMGFREGEVKGKDWLKVAQATEDNGNPKPFNEMPHNIAIHERRVAKTTMNNSYSYTKKNGDLVPVLVAASPVVVNDELIGVIVSFRDITVEKNIDRAKTEFVSLASHQLRTPISTINWYTEILLGKEAGPLTKEQEEFLTEIYGGSTQMNNLVAALLNVSRIELGTFVVEPEPTQITELSRAAIAEIQPKISEKKLNIHTNYDNLPPINLDPNLTHIVFQNLISNAVKYTPENGDITITIKADGNDIRTTVTDTGMGIPEKQQERIFSKLFRGDNVKKQGIEGTGLGLYIAKSIIDHSGGTIWFKSIENQGTTFGFTLPLAGMKAKEGTKKLGE